MVHIDTLMTNYSNEWQSKGQASSRGSSLQGGSRATPKVYLVCPSSSQQRRIDMLTIRARINFWQWLARYDIISQFWHLATKVYNIIDLQVSSKSFHGKAIARNDDRELTVCHLVSAYSCCPVLCCKVGDFVCFVPLPPTQRNHKWIRALHIGCSAVTAKCHVWSLDTYTLAIANLLVSGPCHMWTSPTVKPFEIRPTLRSLHLKMKPLLLSLAAIPVAFEKLPSLQHCRPDNRSAKRVYLSNVFRDQGQRISNFRGSMHLHFCKNDM